MVIDGPSPYWSPTSTIDHDSGIMSSLVGASSQSPGLAATSPEGAVQGTGLANFFASLNMLPSTPAAGTDDVRAAEDLDIDVSTWMQQFVHASAISQAIGGARPTASGLPQKSEFVGGLQHPTVADVTARATVAKPAASQAVEIAPKPHPQTQAAPTPIFPRKDTIAAQATVKPEPASASKPAIATKQETAADSSPAASLAQKRQERLIKNRAAALLSRKRKREQLSSLESQVSTLTTENNELKARLAELEKKMGKLTTERDVLVAKVASMNSSLSKARREECGQESHAIVKESTDTYSKHLSIGHLLVPVLFSFTLLSLISGQGSSSSNHFTGFSEPNGGLGYSAYQALPGTNSGFDETQMLLNAISGSVQPLSSSEESEELTLIERIRHAVNAMSRRHKGEGRESAGSANSESWSLDCLDSADLHISQPSYNDDAAPQGVGDKAVSDGEALHSWLKGLTSSSGVMTLAAPSSHGEQPTKTVASVSSSEGSKNIDLARDSYDKERGLVYYTSSQNAVVKVLNGGPSGAEDPPRLRSFFDLVKGLSGSAPTAARPKLSLYSPMVDCDRPDATADNDRTQLQQQQQQPPPPPWQVTENGWSPQQQYYRLDVEVVGSKVVSHLDYFDGVS
ncbi:hypothetical protein EV182_001971 [Spiromyces aspiralis]|uniref:Uncharacterized protein n=1 Tax=Spiromyces aspiralis TaxID=68401 RepID=A0ACC1HWJ7_9FUNG|nr:hypothetical protein EV182_001971 [Spiromyces aspiralis]